LGPLPLEEMAGGRTESVQHLQELAVGPRQRSAEELDHGKHVRAGHDRKGDAAPEAETGPGFRAREGLRVRQRVPDRYPSRLARLVRPAREPEARAEDRRPRKLAEAAEFLLGRGTRPVRPATKEAALVELPEGAELAPPHRRTRRPPDARNR